jgi:hypothetical protein
MLAADHQHHKSLLIKRQQPSPLGLGLPLSIGIAQQIHPLKHAVFSPRMAKISLTPVSILV